MDNTNNFMMKTTYKGQEHLILEPGYIGPPSSIIKPGRRVGNTTRLVDWYVQQLFNGAKLPVRDHGPTEFYHKELRRRIKMRLKEDHYMEIEEDHHGLIWLKPERNLELRSKTK